jgi:diketogulonate reductase-like aldo/keto reductase
MKGVESQFGVSNFHEPDLDDLESLMENFAEWH